jgi:2-(1,2-epoxy-1,2-dihydrophenyl)acetyl-CoA isomerase
LLWSGDFISAEEAERIGLLSKVFDDEKLMDETYAFAERLAHGPSIAIRLTKQAVYQCLRMDFLNAWCELAKSLKRKGGFTDTQTESRLVQGITPLFSMTAFQ